MTSVRIATGVGIQCSVHGPSPFICTHARDLLPEWSQPIKSVLVVLQQSRVPLIPQTDAAELQKRQLRDRFFKLGLAWASQLQLHGYYTELFDPKTGRPVFSASGRLSLDDVAVVHRLLGYAIASHQGCTCVLHPHWGSAVYPSTLVTTAPPSIAFDLIRSCFPTQPPSSQLRSGVNDPQLFDRLVPAS